MKLIRTEDAVGHVLCHDMTQIKGTYKDARFRKGHIVAKEDIPVLLSMGKEWLYVWEKGETRLHEDEAAEILYQACANTGMDRRGPKEGKITLSATTSGVFEVDRARLFAINSIGQVMIATRANHSVVHPGDDLAGMRIIPLVIEKDVMAKVSAIASSADPILSIHPFVVKKASIIVTGNEVEKGLIQDAFSPKILQKLDRFQVETMSVRKGGDDKERLISLIHQAKDEGSQLILLTGGMSVDPDDRTPAAIRDSGAKVVSYGAPVLPGAMLMVAYLDGVAVVGVPGCAMHDAWTVLDLVLPRLLCGVPITAQDIAGLGDGGLCLHCPVCHFPNCTFGHGGW